MAVTKLTLPESRELYFSLSIQSLVHVLYCSSGYPFFTVPFHFLSM